jgi:hypothetical protein
MVGLFFHGRLQTKYASRAYMYETLSEKGIR